MLQAFQKLHKIIKPQKSFLQKFQFSERLNLKEKSSLPPSQQVIGIDLGTANAVVAILQDKNAPKVIENAEGIRVTPSVVSFSPDGTPFVGTPAKRAIMTNPENTIYAIKRLIGKNYDEVEEYIKTLSYQIKKSPENRPLIQANGEEYLPEQIAAVILKNQKQTAEAYLSKSISSAVITVPAYFNEQQRDAMKESAKLAGLTPKRLLNEPVAAALAFSAGKSQNQDISKVAVYDFGGSTFDFSVLEYGQGVYEVRAFAGDLECGGNDIDDLVTEYIIKEFENQNPGVKISQDKLAFQRIREAAEKAKLELSSTTQTEINLPYITADVTGPKHVIVNLTRGKFENIIRQIINKTFQPIKQCLEEQKIEVKDFHDIIAIGGCSKIPLVQKYVEEFFQKKINRNISPDEAIAMGASLQGSVLEEALNEIKVLDYVPLSIGIETRGGIYKKIVERGTPLPTKKCIILTSSKDNQQYINIHLYQGERPLVKYNRWVASNVYCFMEPTRKGWLQIKVEFDIDLLGQCKVSIREKDHMQPLEFEFIADCGIPSYAIQEKITDFYQNQKDDKKEVEEIKKILKYFDEQYYVYKLADGEDSEFNF
ncbi:hypothetical protein IMG5_080790 [Ichthyophthirius multifiliis]|uniref:Uncharacterized protein n=1 Tax=Ichthyophthirius multifiliis TaxID=5932 RepID=G0QQK5_ICHMU|nr:hypothetical protein IMG5_080790 [Ichthyophthirius multifiliis]EGR32499.1 hypothetical protein IMG5_080790 [Ichthyophthirius multifiliis]|eukprot:XP_004036485.1 hypothetical protein IMG5_080790 [Ichthyophthirius multifiliis]